jgi:hypothetical protein
MRITFFIPSEERNKKKQEDEDKKQWGRVRK